MTKARSFLNLVEGSELDPAVVDLAKKLYAAFKQLTNDASYRTVSGEKYGLKTPAVEFEVPIIHTERGKDTSKNQGDAQNSNKAFKEIIDKIWHLRQEGWMITQPRGKSGSGWEDKNTQNGGTTMEFAIGK